MAIAQFKIASLLSAVAFALPLVAAHGHTDKWTFGGVEHPGWNPSNAQAYNKGITAQRPSKNSDQGYTDYTSGIVACGGPDAGSGLETWDLNAGDDVTVSWDTWPESHKGPVTEYMAYCGASCDGVAADSLEWFKIQEDGFSGGVWASETIAKTKKWNFKIPAELAPGAVLVRHDILAMHTQGGPQVYPYCFQANLKSSGTVKPADTVTFPAAYTMNTDFLQHSIYNGDNAAFVAPGPPVYNAGSAPAPAPAPSSSEAVPVPSSSSAAEPVPSSTSAAEPAPTTVEPEYPTEPTTSTVDEASTATSGPAPTVSDVTPVEPSATAEPEYPAPVPTSSTSETAPVETSALPEPEYPAPSASAPVVTAPAETSAAAPAPTGGAGGANLQTATGTIGGAAPGVYASGEKYKTGSNTFNFLPDALYRSCDEQRNACYDFANSQYGQTGSIQGQCETQASSCKSSISWSKRSVAARWAKRGASIY